MTKEMVYQDKWLTLDQAIVLSDGFYKGYEYCVLSYGIHPCAYVALSKGQPFYNATDYSDVEEITCHGGCTFIERGLGRFFNKSYTIMGWDYGHCDDYSGLSLKWGTKWNERSKKWTTKEMVQECKDVIEQLYFFEHPELLYK